MLTWYLSREVAHKRKELVGWMLIQLDTTHGCGFNKLALWLDKRYDSVALVQSECPIRPITML